MAAQPGAGGQTDFSAHLRAMPDKSKTAANLSYSHGTLDVWTDRKPENGDRILNLRVGSPQSSLLVGGHETAPAPANRASPLADVLPRSLKSGAFALIDSSDAIAAMRKAPIKKS